MLLCSGAVIITGNTLYSAERKEQKTNTLTTAQWHYEHWWHPEHSIASKTEINKILKCMLFKRALQKHDTEKIRLYAPGLDLWSMYIEALKAGQMYSVSELLKLISTKGAYIQDSCGDFYRELSSNDCSGLVTVIEARLLSDEVKKQLIDMIIDCYQPNKLECEEGCCFSCTSRCNQRRAAFIVYGLAKAGERCLELKKSEELRKYIYDTRQAYITQDALNILERQHQTDLKKTLTLRRDQQNRHKQLLLIFQCIKSTKLGLSCQYFQEIAQPVITNRRPDAFSLSLWPQLCNKE
jgi:hypothetical protein